MNKKLLFSIILVMLLLTPTTVGADPRPGLVGLWHFDEGSGETTVTDSSGYGNDGNVVGATTGEDGKFGNALSFDGVDDYVTIANSDDFDFGSGEFSVEFWTKTDSSSRQWVGTRYENYGPGWGLGTQNGHTLGYIRTSESGTGKKEIEGDVNVADNAWHHLIMVRIGDEIKIYTDGSFEKEGTLAGDVNNDEPIEIGRISWSGGSQYFKGLIDEVRIWDEALTPEQIALSYSGRVNWLPPVTNADFTLQEGTTLPLKFQLYDDGVLVDTPQDVLLQITGPDGFTTIIFQIGDGVENLRWNADEDHYIANLKAKDWTEGTYRATVFWDGVVINETITFYISPLKGAGRGNSGK